MGMPNEAYALNISIRDVNFYVTSSTFNLNIHDQTDLPSQYTPYHIQNRIYKLKINF